MTNWGNRNMITHQFTGDIKIDVKSVLHAHDKTKTYDHVKAVAEMNKKIAEQYGLDRDICELCGYLHDISAIVSHTDMMDYAIKNDWHIDESERKYPMLLHQRIARVIAQENFGVTDERILSAVEHHTTLRANPSAYDMAVFIADKLAWDGEGEAPFHSVVRNALRHSLEAACLAYQDYIVEHRIILHPHRWFEESVRWLRDAVKNVTIKYKKFDESYLDGVLTLSQDWFHENITFGIVPDTAEDVASYKNEYFHVALDGECVIGYITAEIVEGNEYNIFPHSASYLRVNDLYIAKEYRSRRIGEELLALVEQKADENKVQHTFISSATKDSDAVRKFYQRNGYSVWATSFYKRNGWDVRTYPLGDLCGYRYTVIFARYQNKWLYCRAKERDTFETAGGHIEKGEKPLEAAKREFFEETGVVKFDIKPVFDYAVYRENDFANGQVFLAEVHELGDMPCFEMSEVKLFDTIPDKMRFPQILPVLFEKVRDLVCN